MSTERIHNDCISNFDIASLPLITNAWSITNGTDIEVLLKYPSTTEATSNSIMIEVKADTWIVIDGVCAYPVFADQPLTLSLKFVKKLKFIGTNVSYRFLAMTC